MAQAKAAAGFIMTGVGLTRVHCRYFAISINTESGLSRLALSAELPNAAKNCWTITKPTNVRTVTIRSFTENLVRMALLPRLFVINHSGRHSTPWENNIPY